MKIQLLGIAVVISLLTACTQPYQTIHATQAAQTTQMSSNVDSDARLRLLNKLSFYPKPKEKYKRNVIYLPKVANEKNLRVELVIGFSVLTDCNYYQLSGDFQKKTLYGWGYPYYEIVKLKGPMSTMLTCPDNRKTTTFLRVMGTEELQPYSSDYPLVIYAPSGLQIKYKIWESLSDEYEAVVE